MELRQRRDKRRHFLLVLPVGLLPERYSNLFNSQNNCSNLSCTCGIVTQMNTSGTVKRSYKILLSYLYAYPVDGLQKNNGTSWTS